jgi:ABC-2 type transport system permease protein
MNPAIAASSARERCPSEHDGEPLPLRRTLRAYLIEAKFELLGALRTPAFAFPMTILPTVAYVLFGILIIGDNFNSGPFGRAIANYLFAGFATIGTIMGGVFGGATLATDRDLNLVKLQRALPMPAGAVIVAKLLMTIGIAFLAVTPVVLTAIVTGKLTISPAQALVIGVTLILGTVPFCAIGLLIGTLGSGSAASAYGNLAVLPQIWLSGLFIPLPAFLQSWVVIWPAFHVSQLALHFAGVKQFSFVSPEISGAMLVGVTVLCGGLAVRRLARVG